MIKINPNIDELLDNKDSIFYCYGCGKRFYEFIEKYPNVIICGLVDKYRSGEDIVVNNKLYCILSLDDFFKKNTNNLPILITPDEYEEIVEYIDADNRSNGHNCYILAGRFCCLSNFARYTQLTEYIKKHNDKYYFDRNFKASNYNSNIKRYQIWNFSGESFNAGSKAPIDVMHIVGGLGYQRIDIHAWRGKDYKSAEKWSIERNKEDWKYCKETISLGSILFLQHPFWQFQEEREKTILYLKYNKNIKIISFIHDIEELRKDYYTSEMKREFDFMLKNSDVFIVHSQKMKEFLLSKNVKKDNIIVLGIFDYLCSCDNVERKFDKSVIIAGNLDRSKGKYIDDICKLQGQCFHLYGIGYDAEKINKNIKYHGAFLPDDLPNVMSGGFGLIWNGDSLDSCDGNMGNYLRYNSPHKLSLYIAAGIPVITWSYAASAEFIKNNRLGITVDSLIDLPMAINDMTEKEYMELKKNIDKISMKVKCGEYTKMAIDKAEKVILKLD